MREEGFEVREFASVEEYLEKAAGSIADVRLDAQQGF